MSKLRLPSMSSKVEARVVVHTVIHEEGVWRELRSGMTYIHKDHGNKGLEEGWLSDPDPELPVKVTHTDTSPYSWLVTHEGRFLGPLFPQLTRPNLVDGWWNNPLMVVQINYQGSSNIVPLVIERFLSILRQQFFSSVLCTAGFRVPRILWSSQGKTATDSYIHKEVQVNGEYYGSVCPSQRKKQGVYRVSHENFNLKDRSVLQEYK